MLRSNVSFKWECLVQQLVDYQRKQLYTRWKAYYAKLLQVRKIQKIIFKEFEVHRISEMPKYLIIMTYFLTYTKR